MKQCPSIISYRFIGQSPQWAVVPMEEERGGGGGGGGEGEEGGGGEEAGGGGGGEEEEPSDCAPLQDTPLYLPSF